MPSSTSTEFQSDIQPLPDVFLSGRTIEDVEEVITLAKLDKDDLLPVSQEILFDSKFSANEFRFVQLDKDVLESIQTGQILVFRGGENDAAVLCSDNETYEIKDAETSNSLLLFSELEMPDVKSPTGSAASSKSNSANTSLNNSDVKDGDNDIAMQEDGTPFLEIKSRMIIHVAHSYLEMKRMRPNLSAVRLILLGSDYDETTDSLATENDDKLVTMNTLLERVPASDEEIEKYLDEIRVLNIDGKLRIVDDDYLFRIFSQVLNCVDENSWSPNEIDKDVIIHTLSSLAKSFLLEKIFQWFFEPIIEPGASSSKVKYTYNEDKVCRFLGETLLKTMGKYNLKDFMKVWQESVPEGLKVSLKQLQGVSVYDEECSPTAIWYFPEHNLPQTLTERLAVLFATKKRWKIEEISPFIELFTPPSQNVGNILTKYTRSTTVNGTKYYTSKHGK